MKPKRPRRLAQATLGPYGIELDGERVPLFAGSVHYWRLEPRHWRPALEATKSLGLRLIDTYVPWGVHETAAGEIDLGARSPRLDIAAFLRLVGELGLYAVVRPGPHVNAELTFFGLPERVVWDPACQARSASGKPVVLPVPPLAFPVPSYASEAFHAEVAQWFAAIGPALEPLCWPRGPIVLAQVDNEGALYFRDGVYDQDYHEDAIAQYRRFLQKKYRRIAGLRDAHRSATATFTGVEPPRHFDAAHVDELARHLDWAEFQEQMLADSLGRMAEALRDAGLGGVPTTHNLPLAEAATPLDPERIGRVVDLIGLDYYHPASALQHSVIARRTSELALRSEARKTPAFACELGAGFPPFYPPLDHDDNAFAAMTALAYGLRGFNLYMAVERDRWIGAPIDVRGRRRATADFWQRLTEALVRTRFAELRRDAAVHLLVPRAVRRLARTTHAFGPLSAALFGALGQGAIEACFEDELGLPGPAAGDAERFLYEMERALSARGIPWSWSSGDLAEHSLGRAAWTVVACTGAIERHVGKQLQRGLERGCAVSFGPLLPERDEAMHPSPRLELPTDLPVPLQIALDPAAIAATVEQAVAVLGLPTLAADPSSVAVTLHRDSSGRPAVAFLINPSEHAISAALALDGIVGARDALDLSEVRFGSGRLEARIRGRSVRMLELDASGC